RIVRRTEAGVVTRVQQHSRTTYVQGRERTDVDTGRSRAGHSYDHGRQVHGLVQRYAAQVVAIREPMVRRVQIGPGVTDQAEPVDHELRARRINGPRLLPRQIRADLRPR